MTTTGTTTVTTTNALALLGNATQDGALSPDAAAALTVPDMGTQIQAALGVRVDDVPASEVVLVSLLIDDSGSIAGAGNERAVRDGHNLVLDALTGSKQKDAILALCLYLNGKVLYPCTPVVQAKRMDGRNYRATGGTPLYDQSAVLLGTVLAKAQEFADNGVVCRTVTLIVTDGDDCGSVHQSASSVKKVVKDLLRAETHIIAGMGVDDGRTDFRAVFRSMGIPDEWILTPGSTASEIRKAFQIFSQSAVRASQTAASFSQTAAGGFAAP